MATKARTIKLADLTSVIDEAVQTSAGRNLAGSTIIGRQLTASVEEKLDPNELARDITKEMRAAIPDATLTPKVLKEGKLIICGFIIRPERAIR